MKIHCIRHEPFEGLAEIEDWIKLNNHHLTYTRTYLNQSFPEEIAFDLLIIMGGTASVYQDKIYPWLTSEIDFIKKTIAADKKVIGICLGAQLLAKVLGAKVYPNTAREIGWYPIRFCKNTATGFYDLPEQIEAFHWHSDTFDLPKGAHRIASSEITPNQGFILGRKILRCSSTGNKSAALKKLIKHWEINTVLWINMFSQPKTS
jgi:GMP synthase (glutamine-hydrolysing)